MISFKPLSNTVIVELEAQKEITRAGIIIPHQKIEQPIIGVVVAIGQGKKYSNGNVAEMTCKVGDKVLFAKFAGSETTIDDRTYIVMSEEDIMAVIQEEQV